MRVLLSAFACCPGYGSEPGTGWHWVGALADLGHEVTVLTMSDHRDEILASCPQGVHFRFIDIPTSPVPRFSKLLWSYDAYGRWQDAAARHVEAEACKYDVAHHVTYGGLHLGSMLWRLPIPLVYGPVGGGQTAPADYWRYFGREWPSEILRTASAGPLLKLNRRCGQTIKNSAVTLINNSATAAACRRLGGTDIRYMLADGLSSDWIADARPQPSNTPVVLWVGTLLPRKAPTLAVRSICRPSPGHAGAPDHRWRRAASRAGARNDRVPRAYRRRANARKGFPGGHQVLVRFSKRPFVHLVA